MPEDMRPANVLVTGSDPTDPDESLVSQKPRSAPALSPLHQHPLQLPRGPRRSHIAAVGQGDRPVEAGAGQGGDA